MAVRSAERRRTCLETEGRQTVLGACPATQPLDDTVHLDWIEVAQRAESAARQSLFLSKP